MSATHPTKRLPRGRVMWMHPFSLIPTTKTPPAIFHQKVLSGGLYHVTPVAVIPCATRKQAAQWVKLAGAERGAQKRQRLVQRMAKIYHTYSGSLCSGEGMSAVLTALLGPEPARNGKEGKL